MTDHYRAMMISYKTDGEIQEEIIYRLGIRDEAQKQYDALCAEREKRRQAGTWDPYGKLDRGAASVGVGGRPIA